MSEYLSYLGVEKLPVGYWGTTENLKHFMSFVAWKEGYTEIDDWYKCSRKKLTKYGLSDEQIRKNYKNFINILNLVYDKNWIEKDGELTVGKV